MGVGKQFFVSLLLSSLRENNNMLEEKVKWFSKKKYTCKRNKGEHEYLKPIILYQPSIRYIYKSKGGGQLHTNVYQDDPDYKYLRTEATIVLESVCKHCGHKVTSFMRDIIN